MAKSSHKKHLYIHSQPLSGCLAFRYIRGQASADSGEKRLKRNQARSLKRATPTTEQPRQFDTASPATQKVTPASPGQKQQRFRMQLTTEVFATSVQSSTVLASADRRHRLRIALIYLSERVRLMHKNQEKSPAAGRSAGRWSGTKTDYFCLRSHGMAHC